MTFLGIEYFKNSRAPEAVFTDPLDPLKKMYLRPGPLAARIAIAQHCGYSTIEEKKGLAELEAAEAEWQEKQKIIQKTAA